MAALVGSTVASIGKVSPTVMAVDPVLLFTARPVTLIYCVEAEGTPETSTTITGLIASGAVAGTDMVVHPLLSR
jgi:hypothetical protein